MDRFILYYWKDDNGNPPMLSWMPERTFKETSTVGFVCAVDTLDEAMKMCILTNKQRDIEGDMDAE